MKTEIKSGSCHEIYYILGTKMNLKALDESLLSVSLQAATHII